MACWLANISQLFSKIIWLYRIFTAQSALWPIQNTTSALWPIIQNTTKRFVAYLFKTPQSALWSSSLLSRFPFWQGLWSRFSNNPYMNYACHFLTDSSRLLFEHDSVIWRYAEIVLEVSSWVLLRKAEIIITESPIQDFIPQNTHYSYQIEHWNLLDVVTFHNTFFMYKF